MSARRTPKTPETPKTPQPSGERPSGESESNERPFKPDTSFQLQIGVTTAEIDDETIISDSLSDRFFRLNATGSFIWQYVKKGETLAGIVAKVTAEFRADPKVANEAAENFLRDLVKKGLVVHSTD